MSYMGGRDSWRGGNSLRSIYEIQRHRLGSNDRQPREDDYLALCVQHAGDCFYRYVPVRLDAADRLVPYPERKFGAYAFREEVHTVDERTFHLLQAGVTVQLVARPGSPAKKGHQGGVATSRIKAFLASGKELT